MNNNGFHQTLANSQPLWHLWCSLNNVFATSGQRNSKSKYRQEFDWELVCHLCVMLYQWTLWLSFLGVAIHTAFSLNIQYNRSFSDLG